MICRSVFGVLGANIPAIIRGLIAVAWYGIQTFLASAALDVVLIKLFPSLAPYAVVEDYGFAGLSALGWASFLTLWVLQACVFWRGMESIRRFIDFCGPAAYVVMLLLCGYLISQAGWSAIDLTLGEVTHTGWASVPVMLGAIVLVVSYFSGPILNFGDFSRYGMSYAAVKKGNFLGLPVNFLVFSLLVVITASLTLPVYGELITPWNLYDNPEVIHYTLETLGAFIGPLFGILIADYYLVRKQKVIVDDLFTMSEKGAYFYRKGYNPAAVIATVVGAVVAMIPVLFNDAPGMGTAAQYSWFIGCGLGFVVYHLLATRTRLAVRLPDRVAQEAV